MQASHFQIVSANAAPLNRMTVMPRRDFEQHYSEEKLAKVVAYLNAFTSEYFPWQITSARKQHEDIFGEIIKPGEEYYKIQHGAAFDDVLKLSKLSMERLCFVLFESTNFLKPIAEQILKQRHDAMLAMPEVKLPEFIKKPDENQR